MILYHLKLAIRLQLRHPLFVLINLVGLSIGLVVFFILHQYSVNELDSDRQWKDSERIARIGYFWRWTDDNINWSESQFGVWATPQIPIRIAEDFSEVEMVTRIFRRENFTAEHMPFHGKSLFLTRLDRQSTPVSFKEEGLVYADPNVFNFFSIPLIAGSSTNVLQEVNSIVLSQSMAEKYFGDQDAVNQTLLLNNHISLLVTGIFRDLPENSHLEFDAVISDTGIENYINKDILSLGGCHAYIKLRPDIDAEAFEQTIRPQSVSYFPSLTDDSQVAPAEFYVQPLAEVPFTNFRWDYFEPKSEFFLNALQWTGFFTLFIAWVNYIQLSVSFYLKRLTEIGIRKSHGARITDLVKQFIVESILLHVLSLVLALTMIQLVENVLETWFEFYLLPWGNIPTSTWLFSGLIFLTGVAISVLLPLLIFNRFSARTLFQAKGMKGRFDFAKSLVVVQFCLSIILIICVFTIHSQVRHVLNTNYGLNREEVVLIDLPLVRTASYDAEIRVAMEKLHAGARVDEVTFFSTITGDADNQCVAIKRSDATNELCVDTNGGVDENFIPFFGIRVIAGRNFRKDMPSDSQSVIVSRRAVARLGFKSPEDAIGSRILVNAETFHSPEYRYVEIIGVVEDFKGGKESFLINEGMGDGHGGIILTYKDRLISSAKPRKIATRISPENFATTRVAIERIYREIFPGELFQLNFLDAQIARFYDRERTMRNQIMLSAFIAISIACMGLVGMISNRVVEKTKEIGIRKVLGAEMRDITTILLSATARQIALASLIGIPVAYFLTGQYLLKYSERIDLQWWHFAMPVGCLIVIMLMTVAVVVWKAATRNPVEVLKYE